MGSRPRHTVLGESEQANDNVAPVLVSSNPANGATGASATGSIVLTFNERIKAGTGVATLNGGEIAPTVNGKTAVFPYTGLDYNTAYTFTLPAGVITDRSGNSYEGSTFQFTTMERTQPVARLYDAIVAADGSGDYLTVQDAIDAAPAGRAIPWLIFIKNGEYKGHVDVPKNKSYLHFIGQERDKVIITDDKLCGGDNALHVSVGATVVVNANDCYFDNLTLENSWGHDKQAGPQALALNTSGDRTVFKNVVMLSYQDTWITPSTSNYRVYAKDCFIEGAVDFIYNSGNIYIDNTTLYINRKSDGYIVAPSHGADVEWGYVFMNCRITESCAAPVAAFSADKSIISWDAVPYAICYVVVKNGTEVSFTTETSISAEAGATYMVHAANEQGGLSAGCNPNATGIQSTPASDAQVVAIYSVGGVQQQALQRGLNIVMMKDAQGTTFARKVVK